MKYAHGEMMAAEIVNLEEMLGGQTFRVRMNSGEYPVRTLSALSPEEFGKVMTLGKRFGDMTQDQMETQAESVLQGIDSIFAIIAPELPRYYPTWRERVNALYKGAYIKKFNFALAEYLTILNFWQLAEYAPKKKAVKKERKPLL